MNIRITDLLDDYFDDSVKLLPPEALETGDFSAPQEPHTPGRLYKPLLVAATLMLVISGAVALGLGFQRGSSPGKSLSGPEPTPTDPTPYSIQESAEEESASTDDFIIEEVVATWEAYSQQGTSLDFSLCISPVPESFFNHCTAEAITLSPEAPYVDIPGAPVLENITLQDLGISNPPEGGELTITGHADITETQEFFVRLTNQDDPKDVLVTNSITISPIAADCYIAASPRGLYRTDDYDLRGVSITRWEVTPNQMQLHMRSVTPQTTDSVNAEELETSVTDYYSALLEKLQENPVIFLMKDGTAVAPDMTAPFQIVIIEETSGDGYTTSKITMDCGENSIVPSQIDSIQSMYLPIAGTPAASRMVWDEPEAAESILSESTSASPLAATLDLPFYLDGEEAVLRSLVYDTTTQEFTWKKEIPQAANMLYKISPEGDMSAANTEFWDLYHNWEQVYWDTFFKEGVTIVFTDGTSASIGSGETVNYANDYFLGKHVILESAPGVDFNTEDLTPDYVIVQGQNYYFK